MILIGAASDVTKKDSVDITFLGGAALKRLTQLW